MRIEERSVRSGMGQKSVFTMITSPRRGEVESAKPTG